MAQWCEMACCLNLANTVQTWGVSLRIFTKLAIIGTIIPTMLIQTMFAAKAFGVGFTTLRIEFFITVTASLLALSFGVQILDEV